MSYDAKFYDSIRDVTIRSADFIVPIVFMHLVGTGYRVYSVVDIGGGQGWWAKTFQDYGAKRAICMDGAYVKDPVVPFIIQDLEKSFYHGEEYDLAVCLEVGEHLSEERASSFIMELTAMAPVVLFSAAIPEQGGENHINEQPPSYWTELFNNEGFIVSGYLRQLIWDETAVASWYRQNLLLALHHSVIETFGAPRGFYDDCPPKELIHPATGNPRLKEHQ